MDKFNIKDDRYFIIKNYTMGKIKYNDKEYNNIWDAYLDNTNKIDDFNLMQDILLERYDNEVIKRKLVKTYPKNIIYQDIYDKIDEKIWGIDNDGIGDNHLGKILMTLRSLYTLTMF